MSSGALPSGQLCFLYTDIEGSTRLIRELGDRYVSMFEEHNSRLRGVWSSHDGVEVGQLGDGFLVVFESADAAVAASVTGQSEVDQIAPVRGHRLRVRMGVHSGYARPRDGAYPALAAHQGSRVAASANGGQIVTTGRVVAACSGSIRAASVGWYQVRDFDEPIELYLIQAEGLVRVDTALRARPAEQHNLLRPLTSFVGREPELRTLEDIVQPGTFTSIVGSGGMGKTRLVTEFGIRVAASWRDGVWLVELGVISDPSQVVGAIAEVLRIGRPDDGDFPAAVTAALTDHESLLILDNCEHVADASAQVIRVIQQRCPTVAVVATTRQPLALQSERIVRIGPLPIDEAGRPAAAVQLLVERAEQHGVASIDVGPGEASMQEICRRLDGSPLAIELAAARLVALSPKELLSGLEDRFRLLRDPSHDRDPRQRSLRALLDWSYDILREEEQDLFRRLGVFAGSFSLEAAAAITGLSRHEAQDTLWSLQEQSLVGTDASQGSGRFVLLESVREYAADRLREIDQLQRAATDGARWLCREHDATRRGEPGWFRDVGLDLPNIRALLVPGLDLDPESAHALATIVGYYNIDIEEYELGRNGIEQILTTYPQITAARPGLLVVLSNICWHFDDQTRTQHALDAFDALREEITVDPFWHVRNEANRAYMLISTGDHRAAFRIGIRVLREGHQGLERRVALQVIACTLLEAGWYRLACRVGEDALQISRQNEIGLLQISDLGILAEGEICLGRVKSAAGHMLEALRLALEYGLPGDDSIHVAAHLSSTAGDVTSAVMLLAMVHRVCDEKGVVLMPSDRAKDQRLYDTANQLLGAARFDDVVRTGTSMSYATAVEQTATILEALAQGADDVC